MHKTGNESIAGNKTFTDLTSIGAYNEGLVTANTGANYAINCATANNFLLTLTANCTFTITGTAASRVTGINLKLKQDATGGRTITWPPSVKWPGGTAPTLTSTAGKADYIALVSMDNGATWDGFVAGKNY